MRVALLVMLAAVVASSAAHAAYAQTIPHITMSTDSDVYESGQDIRVGGLVSADNGGAVTIRVMSPTGAVVAVGQVIPDGRDWSWTLPAEFDSPGTYTILAHYSLTGDPDRRAAATFVFVTAEKGTVAVEAAAAVDGTEHSISYVGDPIVSVHTDAEASLIYITFEGPSGGVMTIPDGLYTGDLVAVEGGMLTPLPDGTYAYSTDSGTLVLAADTVAVPEFGAAMLAAAGAAAAIPALRRFRAVAGPRE